MANLTRSQRNRRNGLAEWRARVRQFQATNGGSFKEAARAMRDGGEPAAAVGQVGPAVLVIRSAVAMLGVVDVESAKEILDTVADLRKGV